VKHGFRPIGRAMSQLLPISDARCRSLGISLDSGCPSCFLCVGVPILLGISPDSGCPDCWFDCWFHCRKLSIREVGHFRNCGCPGCRLWDCGCPSSSREVRHLRDRGCPSRCRCLISWSGRRRRLWVSRLYSVLPVSRGYLCNKWEMFCPRDWIAPTRVDTSGAKD
jgi:hypothetical protein